MSSSSAVHSGPHVIVTGASSGIGRAVARELHARGCRVVLAARREGELEALASQLSPAGHGVLAVPTDVTSPGDRADLLERAEAAFGPPDVLVNNAGVGAEDRPFWESRDWENVLDVNLYAVMALTHAAVPGILARGKGHVINVASVAGHVASQPAYSASKFGVRGFSLALRRELLGSGVHVSAVSPGFVHSEMTAAVRFPMPGPQVVARAVVRLLERPQAEVVVPEWYRPLIALEQVFPAFGDAAVRLLMGGRRR